jgi:hypothetical protein
MEGYMNEKKSTGSSMAKKAAPAAVPNNLDNEIRNRAYEIHIKRGNTPGSNMEDWLKAEREIKASYHLS